MRRATLPLLLAALAVPSAHAGANEIRVAVEQPAADCDL
jgi:hypothetical protein